MLWNKYLIYFLVLSLTPTILLTGCGSTVSSPTPTPITSAKQQPTATPTPTDIPTSTPVPTQIATATPTATPTDTPTLIATVPPTPYAKIVNVTYLNVRSGPGMNYPELGAYSKGDTVLITGKYYNRAYLWWRVPFAGGHTDQGWIYANNTQYFNINNISIVNPPPTPAPVRATATPTYPYAIINAPGGALNVRRGPGSSFALIDTYYNGKVYEITGKDYDTVNTMWWRIRLIDGGQGWIYANNTNAKNIRNVPLLNSQPTVTPSAGIWTITGRVVNMNTGQPIRGASIQARLGRNYREQAVTDANGNFSIRSSVPDDGGELTLTINANRYSTRTLTYGPLSPRTYNIPNIQLY